MRTLFRCELWYPLYRTTMHDAVCTDATQALAWAAYVKLKLWMLVGI